MRLVSSDIHNVLIKFTRSLSQSSYGFDSLPSPAVRSFTAMVAPHCRRQQDQAALPSNLVSALRYAKTHRLLSVGKMVHGLLVRSGLEFDVYISNNLLCAYLSSGAIVHARNMFRQMLVRDSVSWNIMISGLVNLGLYREAFVCFGDMIRLGTLPTHPSLVSVIVACAEMGNSIYALQAHSFIIRFGFSSFAFVGNSLLKCYVEYGDYEDWQKLLDDMPALDDISVQILLRGCVSHNIFSFAVELFKHSRSIGLHVSPYTITSLVSLCSSPDNATFGVQIHGFSEKVGMVMDASVVNSLITMYSRSYTLHDAEDLFELCVAKDIVTWNSLINGYAYNGEGDAGFNLVQRLLSSGILPNESTFLSFLSCCATIVVLQNVRKAHALILKLREGFEQWTDTVILTMYCRTKSIGDAAVSFHATKVKDALSSNLIMGLYRSCGRHDESINLFHILQSQGSQVDEMMFYGVLSSSSRLGFLDFGCQIHGWVIKNGFDEISHLKNSILELYSQCGGVDDMERAFEESEKADLFSWNMMLMGYAKIGFFHKIITIWHDMLKLDIKLNEFSYSALLHACCHADLLLIGEHIHAVIHKMRLAFDIALMNSLLTMYSNCKQMEKAHLAFQEIPSPDSVSWNAMVSGYTQNGFPAESIELFVRMNENGIETNEMTYASIFSSCSSIANLKLGFQFHAQTVKRGFDLNLSVSNSLITMYARCGNIHESSQIFRRTKEPDLITWNSMINAYAHHGLGKEAISLFEEMNSFSEKPNNATFMGILSSCSRAGLVSEACHHFKIMEEVYGIMPSEEHCACLVDTLCRAGKLWDAKLFIESMPVQNCSLVWRTLLSFCRLNGDVKLAEVAAEKIIDLEPCDSAPYVILSDLYAYVDDRTMKNHLRRLMENRGVKKEAGLSWTSS
ncbi:pentatricopeptide repeat-containing protein At4g13650-like [Phalaenopsis equestris]|uniref:pentatricopeptide repeat-containing protein At4g13650-like n=1 Tax=Phalaenopsis equestris TaxID=78828 RepID=UPI0009E27BF9|nr:pentatricopeptide repeat-containing protein At4g13650-like [Phalaenopsis equestris]XP_020573554.1 pentatricopeptide repeat-containing protein At4g13650-like [Phalaenopsis equestris]